MEDKTRSSSNVISSLFQANVGRRDVILKSILRDMRKFYKTDFNLVTRYIKKTKGRSEDFMEQCMEEYIQRRFP